MTNTQFNQDDLSLELDKLSTQLREVKYSPRFFSDKRTCKQALQVVDEIQHRINTAWRIKP